MSGSNLDLNIKEPLPVQYDIKNYCEDPALKAKLENEHESDTEQQIPTKLTNMDQIFLEPDHPLLAKFQQTLKEQLERQVNKLQTEVCELEICIKKKDTEREGLGVRVYDAQQLVLLQQQNLKNSENEILKTSIERKEIETELENIKKKYNECRGKFAEAERLETAQKNELDVINYMMQQMLGWEKRLQSDLAVNKRICNKSLVDKKQYAEEKRQLDFITYRLMTEVFKLENNLDHLDMQLRVKEQQREDIATSISEVNTDIEALEQEQKRLFLCWNSVLVAIGQRDKAYAATKKDLKKEQENLLNVLTEISVLKRMCTQEMEKNEQFTLIKGRIDMDKTQVSTRLTHEQDKVVNVEKKMISTQNMIQQTSKDATAVKTEKKIKQQEIDELQREFMKNNVIKAEIEEKIMTLLQAQISDDKVCKFLNKNIQELKERNKGLEIQLAVMENKNTDICSTIDHQKVLNDEIVQTLEQMKKKETDKMKELADKDTELNNLVNNITKCLTKFDEANKQYDEIVEDTEGLELTPLELKIKNLERQIVEMDEKNAKLKSFWLREQSYIVSMKQERQKQIYDLNLIRKQIMLLQQNNLKLEDELEVLDHKEKVHERTLKNMKYKIDKINEDLWKKKGQKDNLDENCFAFKTEYMNRLKDAEMDCIKLESKLQDMETEKDNLGRQLLDANKEMLAWERKIKLATETQQSIIKAMSADGEIGTMKNEIHRMNIRHGQLKKAQDKLMQDLNHCINRREYIFSNAEALEKKKTNPAKINNRSEFKLKFDKMKIKVQKADTSKVILEKKIEETHDLEKVFYAKLEATTDIMTDMHKKMNIVIKNIEASKFERHKDLEILVFKQHKLRAFTAISKGQYRKRFKTPVALHKESTHHSELNASLQIIVERLLSDFPHLYNEFSKILNTVKLMTLYN